MFLRPLLGFFVESLDVGLELVPIDPPHPSPADLDGGKIAGSHQGIDLRHAHAQVSGHVVEREEARFDVGTRLLWGRLLCHASRLARVGDRYLDLISFAAVWAGTGWTSE